MRYYVKYIDKFDGIECFYVLEAKDKIDARNRYLTRFPNDNASICCVNEIPDDCLTVEELINILCNFPYCMPVYINFDRENIVSNVSKTLVHWTIEWVEISCKRGGWYDKLDRCFWRETI